MEIEDYGVKSVYKPHWKIRKIRHGRVKIRGKWFKPDKQFLQYDGRLDGMVYAFGLYYIGDQWNSEFVYLWGSEKSYRSHEHIEYGPELVNNTFPWCWWHREDLDK